MGEYKADNFTSSDCGAEYRMASIICESTSSVVMSGAPGDSVLSPRFLYVRPYGVGQSQVPGETGLEAVTSPAYTTSGPGLGYTGSLPSAVAQSLRPSKFAFQMNGRLLKLWKLCRLNRRLALEMTFTCAQFW